MILLWLFIFVWVEFYLIPINWLHDTYILNLRGKRDLISLEIIAVFIAYIWMISLLLILNRSLYCYSYLFTLRNLIINLNIFDNLVSKFSLDAISEVFIMISSFALLFMFIIIDFWILSLACVITLRIILKWIKLIAYLLFLKNIIIFFLLLCMKIMSRLLIVKIFFKHAIHN